MKIEELLKQINQVENIEKFAEDNLLKLSDSKDGRYILNYAEQILNTPKNWISHYCRALTLAGTPHNYKIIARGFDRFYHDKEKPPYLEGKNEINYNRPFTVEYKADGSLILVYYWEGKWRINTRGSFAQSNVSEVYGYTWEQLFRMAWTDSLETEFDKDVKELDRNFTYIFELCTPHNQVVEYYPNNKIYLLGVRETQSGKWVDLPEQYFSIFKWIAVPTYPAETYDDIYTFLSTLGPTQEGFVIKQRAVGSDEVIRKKVKTETWTNLSHFSNGGIVSKEKLWIVVFNGEKDETSAVFPHLKSILDEMNADYRGLLLTAEHEYKKVEKIENQKEFAIAIKDNPYKGAFFAVRKGTATMAEGIQKYLLNLKQ